MSIFTSYISLEDSSNNKLGYMKKRFNQMITQREQPFQWAKVKVPFDDGKYIYITVSNKIHNEVHLFGKIHATCRTNFRTKSSSVRRNLKLLLKINRMK